MKQSSVLRDRRSKCLQDDRYLYFLLAKLVVILIVDTVSVTGPDPQSERSRCAREAEIRCATSERPLRTEPVREQQLLNARFVPHLDCSRQLGANGRYTKLARSLRRQTYPLNEKPLIAKSLGLST